MTVLGACKDRSLVYAFYYYSRFMVLVFRNITVRIHYHGHLNNRYHVYESLTEGEESKNPDHVYIIPTSTMALEGVDVGNVIV